MSSLRDTTVLLTGATGFIGSCLRRRLQTLEASKVVLLSRNPIVGVTANEVSVASDLHQLAQQTWQEQGIKQIDVVFHLGAFTPKSGAEADLVKPNYQANLIGTCALLESLPNLPKKLVFASTLDVYQPPTEGQVLQEDSPIAPAGLYGASKLFGEHLVEAYARRTGCRIAILRYGHIYGPGEGAYAKLIPSAIRSLLQGQSPVVYGDGSVLRDFLYVEDAVEATVLAAESESPRLGPINIVSGSSRPIREIVELLAALLPGCPPVKFLADKPGGRSLVFSSRRMQELLGAWPLVPLEQGLALELAAFQQELASSQL